MHGRGVARSLVCGLWIPVALQFHLDFPRHAGYAVGDLPFPPTRGSKSMESNFIKDKSDATSTASTQGEALTADPNNSTAASGLLASTPNTTGLGPGTLGDPDRPRTPSDDEFASADCSSNSCSGRQQLVEVMSSDAEADADLISLADDASVASQRSGLTEAGSQIQKLRLDSENAFVKLKTREKRLFKAALAKGSSRAEALVIATAPPVETKAKRTRADDTVLEPQGSSKKPKKTHVESTKPPLSQVSSSVKLGFTSADSKNPLSPEQVATVKASIAKALLLHPTSGASPGFDGCIPRNEWLLLVCEDSRTADWVRGAVGHIKSISSLNIKLLEESEFPKAHLIRGYFPSSAGLTPADILRYLGIQNEDLFSTKQWRVVQHTLTGTTTHLAMLVDEESYKALTECNGKVKFVFGRIKLLLKNSVPRASSSPARPPSPSPTIPLPSSAPLDPTYAAAVAAAPVPSTSAAAAVAVKAPIPKPPTIVVSAPNPSTGRTRPMAGSGRLLAPARPSVSAGRKQPARAPPATGIARRPLPSSAARLPKGIRGNDSRGGKACGLVSKALKEDAERN